MSGPRERRLSPLFTWRSALADADVSAVADHVALRLSTYMSERGDSAFPSLERLARECKRSKGTVISALRELEEKGWLVKTTGGGRGHSNIYVAQVPGETVRLLNRSGVVESGDESLAGGAHSPSDATGGRKSRESRPDAETVQREDRFPAVSAEAETVLSAPKRVQTRPVNGAASAPEDVRTTPRRRQDGLDHDVISPVPAAAGEGERDVLLEQLRWSLTAELGCEPLTRSEHGAWGRAVAELAEAGATPAQIEARCAAYRRRWPQAALTPLALVRWWGMLGAAVDGLASSSAATCEDWIERTSWQIDGDDAHWIVEQWTGLDDDARARLHVRVDTVREERAA